MIRARRTPRSLALLGALVVPVVACGKLLGLKHGTPLRVDATGGTSGGTKNASGGRGGSGSEGSSKSDAGTGADSGAGGRGGRSGSGGAQTLGSGGSASDGTAATGSKSTAAGGASGGGMPSVAGEGGEAGAGSTGECRTKADCVSADPACDVECRATVSGKLCVDVAADRDGDLHASAACSAAPGDDCDDARDDTYPDAPELCDGLDNDCDGKRDMEDGLTVKKSVSTLVEEGANDADVAWSAPQQTWGVLFSSADTWYLPLDRSGNPTIEPVPVSPNDTGGGSVSIAWGNDSQGEGEFGIAYQVYPDVRFSTIAADGTWGLPDVTLTDTPDGWGSDEPDVVWAPATQSWVTAWTDLRDNTFTPILRTVSPAGALGAEVPQVYGGLPRLSVAGDRIALVSQGWPSSDGITFSDALAPGSPFAVAGEHDVESPLVASGGGSFGVAARLAPDKVTFTELEPSGVVRCGPVLRDVGSFVPSAMIANGDRFAIFSAVPSVRVLEVLPGCTLGQMVELDPEPARYVRAARATDGGILVMWGGYDRPLEILLTGQHFCD